MAAALAQAITLRWLSLLLSHRSIAYIQMRDCEEEWNETMAERQ